MQFRGGTGGNFEGPRDIWRELAQADLRTLGRRSFRVYGPTSPLLDSPTLASWERHNDELVKVVLSHGDLFTGEGPYVAVQTVVTDAGYRERPLQDVIEDERDRLFEHAGIDEGEAPDLAVESEPWFTIDGIPVRAALRGEGRLWAARLVVGGPDSPLRNRGGEPVTITVTGRGIAPDRVALRTVEDLEPYAFGRQERLSALAERREPQVHVRERELPEPAGLDAHRRLVEFSVQHALRLEAAARAGHRPREPRAGRVDRGELWESAVRQQMRLAREDRVAANEAVTALVNQMVRLAERAAWFPGTEDGRAAVEESIRYTIFDSEVPSVAAQRAWRADWERHMAPRAGEPEGGEHLLERFEEQSAMDTNWLEQWQSWLIERAVAGS
ncbi:hypothetical protein ABIA33_002703 [Streptacidiphilus sp. MAP12-16]|uniref:hypothetical protein n=1 Tax=Streptacidiphilus sp. MAP12-16 TaxID=3156300 RepID=UPI0035141A6D